MKNKKLTDKIGKIMDKKNDLMFDLEKELRRKSKDQIQANIFSIATEAAKLEIKLIELFGQMNDKLAVNVSCMSASSCLLLASRAHAKMTGMDRLHSFFDKACKALDGNDGL